MATKRTKAAQSEELKSGASVTLDSLAIELKKRRDELGLSITDLHKSTGIARTALHDYEAGRYKPGAAEIRKLCDVLKISPNRLLFGRDDFLSGPTAIEELLGIGSPEIQLAKAMRLTNLLPREEKDAVITLILGLVSARYSPDRIQKETVAVELLFGVINSMASVARNPEQEISTEFVESRLREVAPALVSEERAQRIKEEREKAEKKATE